MSDVTLHDPAALNTAASIILSTAAINHVRKMLAKQTAGKGLRLGVKATGCSGFAYVIAIEESPKADDLVFPQADGLLVYVDSKSLPFVKGVVVDYVRQGVNTSFRFTNPNETGSCGCGESFTISAD